RTDLARLRSPCYMPVNEQGPGKRGGSGMRRGMILTAILLTVVAQPARTQTLNWRFRWQSGQVLNYRIVQQTQATEVTSDGKAETKTRMELVKRWQVLAVDTTGVATVQHSLASMRLETTTPSGEKLLFDSANPDKSNPKLREELSGFIGVPLATLR